MKNTIIWSRDIDFKIANVAALFFAGIIGLFLPSPTGEGGGMGILGVLISIPIAIIAWAVFELIKPTYLTRNWRRWQTAHLWILPLAWALLMVAFGAWLYYQGFLSRSEKELLDSIISPTIL